MSLITQDPWCRACGATVGVPDSTCGRCHTPLVGPGGADHDGHLRVGRVVMVGRAMFKKAAIVIAEEPGLVRIVSKGEEVSPLPVAEFDQLTPVTLPGPETWSAAGRLWQAVTAVGGGALKAGFALPLIDRVAWDVGRRSLPALRAAVLDRLALGLECEIVYLPVTATELLWYRAVTATRAGDTAAALHHLAALPATGYPARRELVAARTVDLLADAGLAARAVEVLGGLAADDPFAQGIVAALAADELRDAPEVVARVATVVGRSTGRDPAELVTVGRAVARGERVPARAATTLPHVEALDAYLAGLSGAGLDGCTDVLGSLPLECVDELVEVGAVTALPQEFGPWTPPVNGYVRARVAPGTVDDDTLRAARFDAEIARRAYLRSDRATLDGLAPQDPAVVHYRRLLDLRDDLAGATVPPGLRADVAATVTAARTAAAEAKVGPTVVPAAVLADPTVWPLLESAARSGNLRPADPDDPTAHEFVCWTDLCGLQDDLFAGRWSEVVVAGNALAARTRHEPLADEALNMAAFAALQLGHIDDALRLLDRALDNEFTTGHLVNAAVVAANRCSTDAMPYLGRLLSSDAAPHVRAAAVRQAIELWRADITVQDYPLPTATLVRTALEMPLDDDLLADLLKLSAYHDEDWLARTPLRLTPEQRPLGDYFRELARLHSSDTDVDFADFCATLATALRRPDRPAWLDAEKQRVIDLLDKGVHVRYGDAPGFALGAQVLIREGVLDPADQIYLGPQAAAHIASLIEDEDGELKASVEKDLVYDSIALLRRSRDTLTPAQVAFLLEDVGRSTWMVAMHVWMFSGRRHHDLAEEYNGLNERARWDAANRPRIFGLQRALLQDFENDYLSRGYAIMSALDGLTVNDHARAELPKMRRDFDEWRDEIRRLRGDL